MFDHNHLTRCVGVESARTAHVLDRKVANERMPNGGSHEKGTKEKERIVWTPSRVNPRLCEGVEHVDVRAFGQEKTGWEPHGRRKG